MKMVTHLVFGAGSVAAFAFMLPVDLRLSLAVVLSLLVNYAIDELGHMTKRGLMVRSPVTHSVFTAPLWGGAVGYLVWLVGASLSLVGPSLEWPTMILGMVAAYSHLLLDAVTEGGVFFLTKRIAIAHFRSSNVLLNAACVVAGLLLFIL
jgi:hypothetical protein